MKSIRKSHTFLLLLAIGSLSTFVGSKASAVENVTPDALTQKAVMLFKQGKLSEAQEIEDAAIKQSPSNWLSHATKSYFFWHEGNVPDAIAEGQKAVRFGPQNATALVNLGHIYMQLGGYRDAIPLYESACKLAPQDWVPRISLVQAYVGADRSEDALNLLQLMAAQVSDDFAWNYQLGVTSLTLEKPLLAVPALVRAVATAASAEQKNAAETDLLVASILAGDLKQAQTLESSVLSKTYSGEPFVRSAATLLSSSSTEAGDQLFKSALSNLTGPGASEAFYRLGRIFEAKAKVNEVSEKEIDKGNDKNSCKKLADLWLELSRRAFSQAADLNPGAAKNHLALAAVFERLGAPDAMNRELEQARMFAPSDALAPFLSAHLKNSGDLIAVDFQIPTLSCNCHAGKIENVLRSMNGISLIALSHLKPYAGVMLIDPSAVKIDPSLSRCQEEVFSSTPVLKAITPPITFSVISQHSIKTVDEAVSVYERVVSGDVLDFPRQFAPIQLSLPQPQVAQAQSP